jgi:hypothetical protein
MHTWKMHYYHKIPTLEHGRLKLRKFIPLDDIIISCVSILPIIVFLSLQSWIRQKSSKYYSLLEVFLFDLVEKALESILLKKPLLSWLARLQIWVKFLSPTIIISSLSHYFLLLIIGSSLIPWVFTCVTLLVFVTFWLPSSWSATPPPTTFIKRWIHEHIIINFSCYLVFWCFMYWCN